MGNLNNNIGEITIDNLTLPKNCHFQIASEDPNLDRESVKKANK